MNQTNQPKLQRRRITGYGEFRIRIGMPCAGARGASLALGLLAHGAAEQFGQGGIEGCACLLFNLLERLRDGECCLLRLFGGQLVEHLGNTDNASEQGYAFFF